MNKTAIKNFAIWARNKLIADITYKAGLLGINEKEIKNPLPQSTQSVQFFDIGTKEPYAITANEIKQRKKLVEEIQRSSSQSDYHTAFKNVIEEVAYTWFNRLIAVRFMEVNDYLPTGVRVLSSESGNKAEPDLVTHPMEADLDYTAFEKDRIMQLKQENKLDELFRMLFIKQCNALNENLPGLFEKTTDYTELLLNVTFTDKDGVVYHLVNDIPEDDFNVSKEGQVEIIGWLYQYYNTEPKDETFALLKKNVKITKERVPSATQLFTPDWIVRYMVENSLGRLWLEGHPNDELKSNWKYYLDEAEQEEDVQKQLNKIREEYKTIEPDDIKVIDPAMGSGHILVYAFDVLMKIYESYGYSQQDAAKSIVEKNLYGLDIDNRAYQLAYFAVMMKARQYNKKILNEVTTCNVYAIQDSNDVNRDQLKYFGTGMSDIEKNTAKLQIEGLLDVFNDAKEYGSILNVDNYDWKLIRQFVQNVDASGQMSVDSIGIELTKELLEELVNIGEVMARRYDVVVTNPPYMGSSGMSEKLLAFIKENYPEYKNDLYSCFILKAFNLMTDYGYAGFMTSYTWMFLTTFTDTRKMILKNSAIISLVQPEYHSFFEEAFVPICTFILQKLNCNYNGQYIKLDRFYGANMQMVKTLEAIHSQNHECDYLYHFYQDNYQKIPGFSIAYWLKENTLNQFVNEELLSGYADLRQGLITGDNERFLRSWFECDVHNLSVDSEHSNKWFFYHKGGEYRKWYGNMTLVVNWKNSGQEIVNFRDDKGKQKSRPQNVRYYLREGFTWTALTVADFNVRYMPAGGIFDAKGSSGFCNNPEQLKYFIGLCNSKVAMQFLSFLAPTMDYSPGAVSKVPAIYDPIHKKTVDSLVDMNIEISREDWNSSEISWNFKQHPFLSEKVNLSFEKLKANNREGVSNISNLYDEWKAECDKRFHRLKYNEEELNRIFIGIYGLNDQISPVVEDKDVSVRKADFKQDIRSFISYAVGCMLGRYSINASGLIYAGGDWDESKYSTFIPDKDNIIPITDEEYFKDDMVGLFTAFVKKVYGEETLEENLNFVANALGNKGNSSREIIRNYFVKDFFKDHCKVYQKRPIYWLFDSGKENGFKALIYLHRYDENTIGNLRIDYLHRIQRIYENEIIRMQDSIENSKDAREVTVATKRKEKLIKQLKETKEYDEKIAHLALARTAIDLDDGVKVNYEKVQTDVGGKKLDVLAKI